MLECACKGGAIAISIMRGIGPRLALAAMLGLLLSGCKTYPEPTLLPSAGPSPPADVINLYSALSAQNLPSAWPTGLFPGVSQPAAGYLPGKGVLLSVLPSRNGPADGLYFGEPATGSERLIVSITPGKHLDIATAAGVGLGGVAFQVGPESGPRHAPVQLEPLTGGPARWLRLPQGDRGSIDTSFHFVGHELVFLNTRTKGGNDLTSVVACDLLTYACRDLYREASDRSSLDVIALGTGTGHAYLAIKPADPGDPVQGEIIAVPLTGGRPRTLWRTPGVLTSVVRGSGGLAFTEDFGIDEGLYLREDRTMIRITAPGDYPSNPSFGDGYITWWAQKPELLDLRTDHLYRIPGFMPDLYGDLLTYVTPAGVRWIRLPPA